MTMEPDRVGGVRSKCCGANVTKFRRSSTRTCSKCHATWEAKDDAQRMVGPRMGDARVEEAKRRHES